MNRLRIFAIGTVLMFTLTAVAQQAAASSITEPDGVPTVQGQFKLLTAKLDLSVDQQAKLKPILKELHDATKKAVHDDSMSREERLNEVRDWRLKTDRSMREFLNDEQKKKLDQVEQEPHPELHGNLVDEK